MNSSKSLLRYPGGKARAAKILVDMEMIWLSAYASNNPRSDYHWQCDACYDECKKRGKEDIYNRAHKANVEAC